MKINLILLSILALFLSGCSFIEPDCGQHWKAPTGHFEPYQN
jgi:PBP1b-binding outer membrane lipoprotein LpoB